MPVGTAIGTSTNRVELKTLPEAYVIIKRMNYGDSLVRQSKGTKVTLGGTGSQSKEFSGELDIDQEAIALWDFAHCVVEHNITDEKEKPLNFKDPNDVRKLDRAVGEEIGKLIDDINNFEQDQDIKN